jgi:hypothetical protein
MPKTHQVTWSWIGVTWQGRQTSATTEKDPSGSMCSGVAAVRVGIPGALLVGQDLRRRQVPRERPGHEPGCPPPVGVPVDDRADGANQLVENGQRAALGVAHDHCFSL